MSEQIYIVTERFNNNEIVAVIRGYYNLCQWLEKRNVLKYDVVTSTVETTEPNFISKIRGCDILDPKGRLMS